MFLVLTLARSNQHIVLSFTLKKLAITLRHKPPQTAAKKPEKYKLFFVLSSESQQNKDRNQ